jgi:ORF020
MEIHKKIKQRRLELGLTLEKVANYVGVSKATVSRWESGEIENMRRDRIAKLSEILKVKPNFIMGIETATRFPILTCSNNYDFKLPNGEAGDIKIKDGKIHVSIGIPENPKSFKEVNLNDEKNFRLKNALQLLELSIKDIKITSEITADLEKAVAKIFLENYTSDNIEINESEKVDD